MEGVTKQSDGVEEQFGHSTELGDSMREGLWTWALEGIHDRGVGKGEL